MIGTQTVHVVGAAIMKEGRCLVAQRGPSMDMPGKWEFPGGKIERGESPEVALERELREELGIEAEVTEWVGRGDFIENGRRICLDVYLAEADTRTMNLYEHAAVKWVGARDLYSLDWAGADVPILPALHAHMTSTPDANRCPGPVALLAADWGKEPKKRAVYSAEHDEGWQIGRLTQPEGWNLTTLLGAAHEIGARLGCAVLIGMDVSLGIPAAHALRMGASSFIDFLDRLERSGGLEHESLSHEEWRPDTPFFRIPPGRGAKHSFFEAAGGESALLRQIELRTGGNPTFALSGIPGTVGSGSRAVWRELHPLLKTRGQEKAFKLWPFEGDLFSLLGESAVVVGEIYPRAAYALALSDALPAPPRSLAKTQRAEREAAIRVLESASWLRHSKTALPDLSPACRNEDDFDALLTVAAMVRTVAEGRPMSCSLVDPIAEGGILATGDIDLPKAPYRRPTA
jgi:8-oxo-dGTP diphosphatase